MRTRIFLVCAAFCVACIAAGAPGADDTYDKLYSAIRANDLRQMKALLDEGFRANAEGPDGITPLMVAAEIGSLDAMKMLIDRHAEINARNAFIAKNTLRLRELRLAKEAADREAEAALPPKPVKKSKKKKVDSEV